MNRSPKIGVGVHALPEEPAEVLEDALRAPSYLRHVQRGEGARGRRYAARVEVCVRGEFQGLGVGVGREGKVKVRKSRAMWCCRRGGNAHQRSGGVPLQSIVVGIGVKAVGRQALLLFGVEQLRGLDLGETR